MCSVSEFCFFFYIVFFFQAEGVIRYLVRSRGLGDVYKSQVVLGLFFGLTLYGKALRATAVNRLGARLVGIRTTLSGQIAFLLASVIGALSGILIVPITTPYYALSLIHI
mgnify:CR=1 FL=1